MSSSSRAPLIVFGAAFLFVGAIFVFIGGGTVLEQWRYRQQAVRVEAVATGKALRKVGDVGGVLCDSAPPTAVVWLGRTETR